MSTLTEDDSPALATPLPWQQSQWSQVDQLLQQQRMPHALLLSGPGGIGKAVFARALAHYLLCEQPQQGHACGECRACGFNLALTHPDFHWVEAEAAGKQIKVDQVREVVQFLAHTSQQGGYKIAVLYPAEAMNINAANALLKSLEEPAGRTLLILISDAPGSLLATIRSRCQRLSFAKPAKPAAEAWLTPQLPKPELFEPLWLESQGSPLRALSILQSDGLAQTEQLDADFVAMLQGQRSPLVVAEGWQPYELLDILQWLNHRLTCLLTARMAAGELVEVWQPLLAASDSRRVFALLDKVQALLQQLRQGANPNKQLALEELLHFSCDKFHM